MPSIAGPRIRFIRENVRLSIVNGSYSMIATSIATIFLPLYLMDGLHASSQSMALLNSLPAVTGLIASLLGAFWVPRLTHFKMFSVWSIFLARFSYVFLALAPFWGLSGAGMLSIEIQALSNLPQSLGNLGWQSLIAKIIPRTMREGFFSQRSLITTAVGMVSTILIGSVLQLFNPKLLAPYQIFFGLAFGFGLVEVFYLLRHREPTRTQGRPRPLHLKDAWQALSENHTFGRYLAVSAFFNFGWQMAWPIFNIYQIGYAHATGLWIGLFAVASQATQISTFRWWGRMSQRWGGLRMLALSAAGMAVMPAVTILSNSLWYLIVTNLFAGFFLSGITLLLFTELLHSCPDQDQSTYIAGYNAILGLVAFLAPEAGVWLLHLISLNGAMLISSVWRLMAAGLFLRIASPNALRSHVRSWLSP